jgi:hypothetical protein
MDMDLDKPYRITLVYWNAYPIEELPNYKLRNCPTIKEIEGLIIVPAIEQKK